MHLLFYHLCIKRNTYCFVIHQLPKFCHFQFNINMEVDKDICRHCNMQMILFKIKMTFNNFFFLFPLKTWKVRISIAASEHMDMLFCYALCKLYYYQIK